MRLVIFVVLIAGLNLGMAVKEKNNASEKSGKITCVAQGCSSTICVDKNLVKDSPMVSMCNFEDYFACFKKSKCTAVNGKCGWQSNAAFVDCLKLSNAPKAILEKYEN